MRVATRIGLLLLGMFLAEATLQVASAVFPPVEARLSGLKPRYIADPVLYVRGDSALSEYDDFGFRNETRPEQVSIVAIGDSQTEGSGVARANAWPQQLGALLATSVYQLAFGGYGPGQYLELTDDALALRPQSVIVALYSGNDLAGAYDWVYGEGRIPELRTDSERQKVDIDRAERERGPIDRAWRTARNAEKGMYGRPLLGWVRSHLEERSKLVALYDQLRWRISGRGDDLDVDQGSGDWANALRTIGGVPKEILFPFDDGVVRTIFTPAARLAAQDLEDARIAEGLRLTLSILERIADQCRGRARLLVLLMPTKELVFADRVLRHTQAPPEAFTRLVQRETELRARIAAELQLRGIEIADPLAEMRALLPTGDGGQSPVRMFPETWDGHPRAAGYSAVSRVVAAALSRPPA